VYNSFGKSFNCTRCQPRAYARGTRDARTSAEWEQLEGKLQQRYGFANDQIHRDVDDWFRALK
jgi:hypothetical protein